MLASLIAAAAAYSAGGSALGVGFGRSRLPVMQYEVQAETVKVFGEAKPYTFMTVQPYFTVQDWGRAKAAMEDVLACARKDYSAMYSGWSINGNSLFYRVAHTDGDAVVSHLKNIGPCLDRIRDEAAAAEFPAVM